MLAAFSSRFASAWIKQGRALRICLAALLSRPVDITSLIVVRIAFGLLVLWEVMRFFTNDRIGYYFIEPSFNFTFFGWDWVRPWPGNGMYWHFIVLGACALGVALGAFYRLSALGVALGFSYVFLLEQTRYFNHEYLGSVDLRDSGRIDTLG